MNLYHIFIFKDPITGPAEDLGVRLSYNTESNDDELENNQKTNDEETDHDQITENNDDKDGSYFKNETSIEKSFESIDSGSTIYHIPSLCDMLIGFPTQKGFIAYRKPEIGSWYMNAIVQVFSKHSCDTDLCAMLNMVNSMICNEVTNTGKKQMSEFTSKLTKPYFYFFPGI